MKTIIAKGHPRRFLTVLLAALLIFSLLPPLSAEAAITNDGALRSAVAAVSPGVLTDIVLSPTAAIPLGSPLTIPAGTLIRFVGGNITGSYPIVVPTGATLYIGGTTIYNINRAGQNGGAIIVDGGTLVFESGSIQTNNALNGGAIYAINNATVNLIGGVIDSNIASGSGGGIYAIDSTINFSDGSIQNNVAANGGGIYIAGSSSMEITGNAVMRTNTAHQDGGAIFAPSIDVLEQIVISPTNGGSPWSGGQFYGNRAQSAAPIRAPYLDAVYASNIDASTDSRWSAVTVDPNPGNDPLYTRMQQGYNNYDINQPPNPAGPPFQQPDIGMISAPPPVYPIQYNWVWAGGDVVDAAGNQILPTNVASYITSYSLGNLPISLPTPVIPGWGFQDFTLTGLGQGITDGPLTSWIPTEMTNDQGDVVPIGGPLVITAYFTLGIDAQTPPEVSLPHAINYRWVFQGLDGNLYDIVDQFGLQMRPTNVGSFVTSYQDGELPIPLPTPVGIPNWTFSSFVADISTLSKTPLTNQIPATVNGQTVTGDITVYAIFTMEPSLTLPPIAGISYTINYHWVLVSPSGGFLNPDGSFNELADLDGTQLVPLNVSSYVTRYGIGQLPIALADPVMPNVAAPGTYLEFAGWGIQFNQLLGFPPTQVYPCGSAIPNNYAGAGVAGSITMFAMFYSPITGAPPTGDFGYSITYKWVDTAGRDIVDPTTTLQMLPTNLQDYLTRYYGGDTVNLPTPTGMPGWAFQEFRLLPDTGVANPDFSQAVPIGNTLSGQSENLIVYAVFAPPIPWTPGPLPWSPVHHAYLIGSGGLIRPDGNITRGEVATILFRLITDDYRAELWTQQNPFADVSSTDWFNNAVSTMTAAGMFQGRRPDIFAPNDPITRGEFVTVMARAAGLTVTGGAPLFPDIADHWAADYINAMIDAGWINGFGDGTFQPDRLTTRAEAAAIINRVLQRVPESPDSLLPDMRTWPDNMDTGAWFYLYIQEATNSHSHTDTPDGYEIWVELLPPRNWAVLERPDSRPEDILNS
ncbi:MAG: S-layer homology domain-containing protein [Oscillospiraceae bacterium]|nr:S-layer homology domain-containing protein [Oscillospiraceae bacterium]